MADAADYLLQDDTCQALSCHVEAHCRRRPVSDERPVKNREILGKILRVGFPGAMESMLYNMAIMIVISLLNRMDSTGVQAIARAYTAQIANFSMCAGCALKASGDATYPMVIGIIFMFLCAAGGTWYFGVHLGWLAVGAYVGMALDECVRAVFMFVRWHKGVWKTKNLLSKS